MKKTLMLLVLLTMACTQVDTGTATQHEENAEVWDFYIPDDLKARTEEAACDNVANKDLPICASVVPMGDACFASLDAHCTDPAWPESTCTTADYPDQPPGEAEFYVQCRRIEHGGSNNGPKCQCDGMLCRRLGAPGAFQAWVCEQDGFYCDDDGCDGEGVTCTIGSRMR